MPIPIESKTNYTVLQKGYYGHVSLIKDTVQQPTRTSNLAAVPYPKSFLYRVANLFSKQDDRLIDNLFWANKVILDQAIHKEDLKDFPLGFFPVERLYLADTFAHIPKAYYNLQSAAYHKRANLPPQVGTILADTLDVLPIPLAAMMLLCASDYEISKRIYQGWHTKNTEGFNTQILAVEAAVLFSAEKRHEIFEELEIINPGKTRQFGHLIISSWNSPMHPLCGRKLIENNLPPKEAASKIMEVQEDLPLLAKLHN